MELQKQVTSLEISKKLKELGVKQESLFYWWRLNGFESFIIINPILERRTVESYVEAYPNAEMYSAFTVAELGGMLPSFCGSFRGGADEYQCWQDVFPEEGMLEKAVIADTEADARGKMRIYLLENGLIEK